MKRDIYIYIYIYIYVCIEREREREREVYLGLNVDFSEVFWYTPYDTSIPLRCFALKKRDHFIAELTLISPFLFFG